MPNQNDGSRETVSGENGSTLPSLLNVEGELIQSHKEYGCGLDVHRSFIQVSVIVEISSEYYEFKHEFATTWESVRAAKQWVIAVIESKSDPHVKVDEDHFHYCLESTAQYHQIVLKAWLGLPELINPYLAGAVSKKTDVKDASRLALHDLTGIWRTYYAPNDDVLDLRTLIAEREHYSKISTRTSNRINATLLRFGITVGREGSVTKNKKVRQAIMDLINNNSGDNSDIAPLGLPDNVKKLIREEYDLYDQAVEKQNEYTIHMVEKASAMEWETTTGKVSGSRMISLLGTVPGIASVTSTTWLANIITPNRFPNAKACSAYCGLDPSVQVSAKHVTGRKMRKGNKNLHAGLTAAASNLIRIHSEPIGKWGYQLYLQTGRWKKAVNAVARRLSISLYYVQRLGAPFSYEKYHLIHEVTVVDVPMGKLVLLIPEFKRYVKVLKENGINTTTEMVGAYYNYEYAKMRGIGKKFYVLVKDFIDNQQKYKSMIAELNDQEKVNKGELMVCRAGNQ